MHDEFGAEWPQNYRMRRIWIKERSFYAAWEAATVSEVDSATESTTAHRGDTEHV